MKKKATPRVYVQLTAVWGNDDADSTIRISRRRWKMIPNELQYRKLVGVRCGYSCTTKVPVRVFCCTLEGVCTVIMLKLLRLSADEALCSSLPFISR